ncbi:SatD family protein [Ornithinicoccus halotolerans]|uniref:SatD family protein n=1 Tax=Ornithinicoccus halotolerans TaxID=1748220 RepID=UPI001E4428C7|nr:SatD family protein [Ornithinicoccus halotolerans]
MSRDRVTVIGDVVGSRRASDRRGTQRRLQQGLAAVNSEACTDDPLVVTVADEFQGSYSRLGEALHAVARLRAELSPGVDVRFGVGRGPVEVIDEQAGTQDGPGWWVARGAIDQVRQAQARTGWEAIRTSYAEHDPDPGRVAAVRAALVCQDVVLGSLDETGWRIVRGLMAGRTQAEIAEGLGITRQAVQQRRKHGHLPMVLDAIARLRELP